MSVNSTIHRNFVPELEALTEMVGVSLSAWKQAPTMEDRLVVESGLIEQFHQVLTATQEIERLTSRDYLDTWDLTPERRLIDNKVNMNATKLTAVVNMYLDYFNKSQTDVLDLIGSAKRCRQKLATLKLWDRSKDKWLISEPFLNFDFLTTNFTSTAMANVVTSSGFLTLPIQKEDYPTVSKIKIIGSSNGIPGNSEIDEVQTENRLPMYTVDGSADTWFEYERLDTGPCSLGLQFFFDKPDIVNGLKVEAVNLGDSVNWKIEDISYTRQDGTTITISEMVSPDLPQDYFIVKTVGSESFWEIAHMPIRAVTATIKFVQDHSYQMLSTPDGNRVVTRKRYAIGIRKIKFNKHKYQTSGGINSVRQEIPSGMYGAACTAHVYPRNTNLYDIDMNLSIDGGETWQNDLLDLPVQNGETVLLSGNPFECIWSLKLERTEKAFREATSFSDEEPRLSLESMQETVSPKHSPANVKVKGKPYNKEVFVIQPGLVKKSSSGRDATPFGRRSYIGGDLKRKMFFPFSLLEKGIEASDLKIFVNEQEWTRAKTNDDAIPVADGGLGWGRYYLSPDRSYVEFAPGSEAPAMADFQKSPILAVEFMLKEEKMAFEQRSDGFYSKFEQLFDPDKENIRILRLPQHFINTTMTIPKDRKEINLKSSDGSNISYIKDITFTGGINPHQRESYIDLPAPSAPLAYYLDKINGVLYFNKEITVSASVNIEHFTPTRLSPSDFEIWMDGPKPVGAIISPDAMSTLEITDVLSDPNYNGTGESWIAPVRRLDVETGEYSYKIGGDSNEDPYKNNNKIFTLSEDKIIKGSVIISSEVFGYINHPPPQEQPFIDGAIEFLGLTPMEKEYTPYIQADMNGFVEFKLAAGRAWYSEFDILWKQDLGAGKTIFNMSESKFPNGATLRSAIISGGISQPNSDGTALGRAAWAVDSNGLVTVFVGENNELPSGISASYFYTDPTFDRKNRFSVDYDKGTLYLSEELDTSKRRSVFYKTASYSLSYTLAEEVNTYNYRPESNDVEIRTENIAPVNNSVKILWGKAPEGPSLDELKEYFSPIIYQVGVRFQ